MGLSAPRGQTRLGTVMPLSPPTIHAPSVRPLLWASLTAAVYEVRKIEKKLCSQVILGVVVITILENWSTLKEVWPKCKPAQILPQRAIKVKIPFGPSAWVFF